MKTTHTTSVAKTAAALVATAAITLAAASCGTGDDSDDSDDDVVRPTALAPTATTEAPPSIISSDPSSRAAVASVKRFYAAMRDGDAATACSSLTNAQRRETYPGESCQATYEHVIAQDRKTPGYSDRWTAKITYSASAPPNAFVRVKVGGQDPVGIGVVKQRGHWRLGPQ